MSGRVRVKICGITREDDAAHAVALGADALGFVFWERSPRAVALDAAREIVRSLPPFVAAVGVFVNVPEDVVARVIDRVRLSAVQLHGDEAIDDYLTLSVPLLRATSLDDAGANGDVIAWPAAVTPLVDAADRERRGGTGREADWEQARALARTRRIVLAGGLHADNVARAIDVVRPWAVDVSSGVEAAPGIKDHSRLAAFFAAVARAETEV